MKSDLGEVAAEEVEEDRRCNEGGKRGGEGKAEDAPTKVERGDAEGDVYAGGCDAYDGGKRHALVCIIKGGYRA